MAQSEPVATPTTLYLTTDYLGRHRLERDGSETLYYQLPNDLLFREPHSVKLLGIVVDSISPASDGRPALVCLAPFAPLQPLFAQALPVLGTSLSATNVYHQLTVNHLPASGRLELRRLDGEPITVRHDNLCVILHIIPTRLLQTTVSCRY